MKPDTCRVVLMLYIVLFIGGCNDAGEPALLVVPTPSLDGLHPHIADHVQAQRERLSDLALRDMDSQEIADAYGAAGQVYNTYGFLDAAEACYLNAQRTGTDDYRWSYYLGQIYRGQGQTGAAIWQFQNALQQKAGDIPAAVSLARLLRETDRAREAAAVLGIILVTKPHHAYANYLLGQIHLDAGDSHAAVQSLQTTLAAQPEATRVHYLLAAAYRDIGDNQRAQVHLRLRGNGQVTHADPLMSELSGINRGVQQILEAGAAAFRHGDLVSAEKHFRKAITVDPDHSGTNYPGGSTLLAEAHHALGLILVRQGKAREAEAHYREALRYNPRFIAAHYDIALLHDTVGDKEDATHHYEQVVVIEPRYRDALFRLATGLSRTGRCEEALGYLEQMLERFPDNIAAKELQTRCLATRDLQGVY